MDAAFVHEIYKLQVMKCCQPFEYASKWQIQAIAAVYNIRSNIRSVQLSWNDIRCKTLCVHAFIALNMNKPSTSVSTHHFKWDDPLGTVENFKPSFLSDSINVWFYCCCCCRTTPYLGSMFHCTTILFKLNLNRGRISSVGRVLECRVGGRKFNSRGQTNTQDLKMTEKWRYYLCVARMHDHVKWR